MLIIHAMVNPVPAGIMARINFSIQNFNIIPSCSQYRYSYIEYPAAMWFIKAVFTFSVINMCTSVLCDGDVIHCTVVTSTVPNPCPSEGNGRFIGNKESCGKKLFRGLELLYPCQRPNTPRRFFTDLCNSLLHPRVIYDPCPLPFFFPLLFSNIIPPKSSLQTLSIILRHIQWFRRTLRVHWKSFLSKWI